MAKLSVALRRRRAPSAYQVDVGQMVRAWWPLLLVVIWLLLVMFPQLVARQDPLALNLLSPLASPSTAHWFGTDETGRDIFSRCIWAVRYSLGASIAIVLGAAILGTALGGIAGLLRGPMDTAVMRVTDVFLAFPYLILAIAFAAAVGPGLTTVVIALILVWWPSYARIARGQVLALRESAFIEGARAVNTPFHRILLRHLLPHLLPQLSARVSMDVGYAVLALTGLSFLGLGVQPPTPELGNLIADSRNYTLQAWWYSTLPGLFVLAAVLSAMSVGDWLERKYSDGDRR
jgi:peptide/nickel transport system permease protein